MDKSSFSPLLHHPSQILGKPALVASSFPLSPPRTHALASCGFGTFSAATGTEAGVRLVGDSGRFLCFCLGLSLSLRLCKRNQRILEGSFPLLRIAVVREKKGGCVGVDLQPYIHIPLPFSTHPQEPSIPSPTPQLLAGSVPLSLPQLQPTSGAQNINRSP